MTSGFYGPEDFGSSPFDDFLARIYGTGGPGRPVRRVDITRLMSAPARELLGAAASHAAERGGRELDTEQLLWAAASMEPTRTLLTRAGADPDALVRDIEGQEAQAAPGGEPPQLTPGAKRALLDAHQISRAVGSTYIGPEHILFALAANPESGAGRILGAARVTPETLQRALAGQGLPPGAGGPGGRSATPTLDEFGRDLTAPGPGRADRPGHRPGRRDRADRRGAVPPGQEQPGADRRGRGGQDRHRRGHRAAHRGRRRAADAGRQAGGAARAVRRGGRHPLPGRLRGAAEADHRRDPRARRRADHLHRRAAHPGRRGRQQRGRDGRGQHAQARAGPWRAARHRRHHAG